MLPSLSLRPFATASAPMMVFRRVLRTDGRCRCHREVESCRDQTPERKHWRSPWVGAEGAPLLFVKAARYELPCYDESHCKNILAPVSNLNAKQGEAELFRRKAILSFGPSQKLLSKPGEIQVALTEGAVASGRAANPGVTQ